MTQSGEVRDAILAFMSARSGSVTLAEIQAAVEVSLGRPVPPSSVRSYLAEAVPRLFLRTAPGTYDVTGSLSIRGIAREITLPVTYLGTAKDPFGGTRAGFESGLTINRKDFGLKFNAVLDGKLVVSDEIQIMIEGELVEQQESEDTAGG